MEKVKDIRIVKRKLRAKYRSYREHLDPAEKERMDDQIYDRIVSSSYYQNARTLLCFVSTEIEVNTHSLLMKALSDGKQVGVPKCLDRNGRMDFFQIRGMQDLSPAMFSLMEPSAHAPRIRDYQGSVCILPAFAFDTGGYRIGYGKGYYDRFLQKYHGIKVGVCYNYCIAPELPHGRFDVPADYIVTPKYTITVKKEANQGDVYDE